MAHRRKAKERLSAPDLVQLLGSRLQPPICLVLGTPREAGDLVAGLGLPEVTCYQMDLFPAEQLQAELAEFGLEAQVTTAPDLWDLPAQFQTVLFLSARGGERHLKIDIVEQAHHVLRPEGTFIVWSPYETEQAFPAWLKKVYGKVHTHAPGGDTVFWCRRGEDRPRRRHEVTFQARVGGGASLRFVSRPGVLSFGRFDDGARALIETASIEPGDRVADLGCGCGTNGAFAAQRSGESGLTAFVDSNVRATALADFNARGNGLKEFQVVASTRIEGLEEETFDVALANPPDYAYSSIARLFVERSQALLKPGGLFYLVTRQPDPVAGLVEESFGTVEGVERRGYVVLCARKPSRGRHDLN